MGSKYPQKIYTAEFKREAVRLLETSGKSGAVIAQELGISDVAFIPGVNNSPNKAQMLSQVKAIRPRSRKSSVSFGPRLNGFARKGIS